MSTTDATPEDVDRVGGNDVIRRIEIRGPATPEDAAAVVAVLSSLGGTPEPAPSPTPVWANAARQVGAVVRPTRGGWSRSALPR